MMRGNCLLYALQKLWKEGGYLVWRPSQTHWLLPHFLHLSRDGSVLSHLQPVKRLSGWRAVLHKLWFTGEIHYHDLRGNQ